MSSRSGMLDNLLPVFGHAWVFVFVSVCVNIPCMAKHKSWVHGGGSACRPTQWTLEGRFILHHYLVLKDHSNREGAGCVHTQNTLLSSSQSLIYPLNPHLSIASEHILLSHVINLFSAWSVGLWGKRQKVICYSTIRISEPYWPRIKVPKFYMLSQITFWCI